MFIIYIIMSYSYKKEYTTNIGSNVKFDFFMLSDKTKYDAFKIKFDKSKLCMDKDENILLSLDNAIYNPLYINHTNIIYFHDNEHVLTFAVLINKGFNVIELKLICSTRDPNIKIKNDRLGKLLLNIIYYTYVPNGCILLIEPYNDTIKDYYEKVMPGNKPISSNYHDSIISMDYLVYGNMANATFDQMTIFIAGSKTLKGIITIMNKSKKIIYDSDIQTIDRMNSIQELKDFLNKKNKNNSNNSDVTNKINDLEYTNNNIRNQARECNLCSMKKNNNDLINFLLYPDRKLVQGIVTYNKKNIQRWSNQSTRSSKLTTIKRSNSLQGKRKSTRSITIKRSTRKTKRVNSI